MCYGVPTNIIVCSRFGNTTFAVLKLTGDGVIFTKYFSVPTCPSNLLPLV